ncbi:MAG: nucleotidyl transferase AbiEii/AbiGii toxin family protein [Anaerolineae bacterium]|nr:nucleotidyl transferase AbiEii/AbiGii toxin family protein [Anaerolineae bacterium]MCI0610009.1 nucleotidyl transferase AbiEii/AbiGii toxin family protein [Anaerolineae bacterium]
MKEHLATLIQSSPSPVEARNLAREYLQALILQSLQRASAMTSFAFHGGTALRFLYSLPRYSEDLDFALERASDSYNFRSFLQTIRKDLETQGYAIALKVNDQKTVHSAFVRFSGLLYELKLTPHQDEILAVKLEVDTNPPKGAVLNTSLVRRHILLNLQHHDQSSLLAGKLHAILQRPYLKGRDIYDLLWYLSDRNWPAPNLILLNNALKQTNWDDPTLTAENWREIVRTRIGSSSWERVMDDVRPFLASQQEIELLTKENLIRLLKKDSLD